MGSESIAIGCRKPGTAVGSWEGAFVFGQASIGGPLVAAVFSNGMDYVGHPRNIEEALHMYRQFVDEGFVPMHVDDLAKTSGMRIGPNTVTKLDDLVGQSSEEMISRFSPHAPSRQAAFTSH